MESNPIIPDGIKEKIRKLLRQAESNEKSGDENQLNEAMVAMVKVQELLAKYNLDLEGIKASEKSESDQFVRELLMASVIKTEGKWLQLLYSVLCNHNLCDIIMVANTPGKFYLLGKSHNLELVKFLADVLIPKLRKMARESFRKYDRSNAGDTKKNAYIRGYLRGACLGIDDKLRSQKQNLYTQTPGYSALVLVNTKALQEFTEKEFPRLKSKPQSRLSAHDAKAHGRADGRNIDLSKPISNSGFGPKQLN